MSAMRHGPGQAGGEFAAQPESPAPAGLPQRRSRWVRLQSAGYEFVTAYGLLGILVALFLIFSVTMPDTFPTRFNIESMLSEQAVTALLALAVMVPMTVGQFDLSVGYFVGLAHI